MGFSVKVETKGLSALITRMEKLDNTEVEVGFFEGDNYGPENGNYPVALVAFLNEYGHSLTNRLVPERPFMHETFGGRNEQLHMAQSMRRVFVANILDGRSIARLLKATGEMVKDMLQVAIDDYPGSNSASTIKRKGGRNDPLYDTGKMLESVKFKVHRR